MTCNSLLLIAELRCLAIAMNNSMLLLSINDVLGLKISISCSSLKFSCIKSYFMKIYAEVPNLLSCCFVRSAIVGLAHN